ncbi:hypothetical protein U1Q18_052261 [Sarracenia purpurea var. burkii]
MRQRARGHRAANKRQQQHHQRQCIGQRPATRELVARKQRHRLARLEVARQHALQIRGAQSHVAGNHHQVTRRRRCINERRQLSSSAPASPRQTAGAPPAPARGFPISKRSVGRKRLRLTSTTRCTARGPSSTALRSAGS